MGETENKRFYWLKLEGDFFVDKRVKKLRKIAGGDTYTIILLKLMILTMNTEGILVFEGVEDTIEEELALDLEEDEDDIKITLNYMLAKGIMEQINDTTYFIPRVIELTGSETASTKRSRLSRARNKMLQCNGKVLQCNNDATPMQQIATERERREREEKSRVDKEIEKSTVEADEEEIREETPHMASSPSEKKKPSKKCFGDYKHVRLTEDEFNRLENEYGSVNTEEAIKYLDEYIEMKGTKYKNHNLVLRKWVFDAVKEKKRKANNNNGNKKSAFGQTSRTRVAQELDETYSMLAGWAGTE
jgi:predicted phage replisome organizer